MFDKLLSLFKNDKADDEAPHTPATNLAVAAILVEAARADENYTADEQRIIDATLRDQFDVSDADAETLRAEAEEAQAAAVDLHKFTKVAKEMAEPDKIRLVETLWRIVLSDGARDQYEDALIRRLCGLIYVDDRASGEARQRVEAEQG